MHANVRIINIEFENRKKIVILLAHFLILSRLFRRDLSLSSAEKSPEIASTRNIISKTTKQ